MQIKFNVMGFFKLPIELQDYIFLLCDANLLENTREFQSEYVQQCTKHFSYDDKLNKLNFKWLFYQSIRWGIYMHDRVFLLACIHNDMEIIKFMFKPDRITQIYQLNGFKAIIANGDLKNVQVLQDIGVNYDFDKAIIISKRKNLHDITEWLLKNKKMNLKVY